VACGLAELGGPKAITVLKKALIDGTVDISWIIPIFVSKNDYSIADLIIRAIFPFPRRREALKVLIGVDFFRSYHSLVLQAGSYKEDRSDIQYSNKYATGDIFHDIEDCFHSVNQLAEMGTPIAVNILHEITTLKNVKVIVSQGCLESTTGELDFTSTRDAAQAALQKLGNSPYRPELYLNGDNWNL